MTELVTSAQNPKVKRLLSLQEKSSLRRETGLFVLEGRREIERAVAAGYTVDTLFVCPEIMGGVQLRGDTSFRRLVPLDPTIDCVDGSPASVPRVARSSEGVSDSACTSHVIEVPKWLYEKVAYRGGTEGMIAEVRSREHDLAALSLPADALVVVLESVEKPGNLGAVLRSADAAGADAVIVCDPLTDIYNPNLLRASTGAVFSVPVACCTSEEAIVWLKSHSVKILTAQLQDSELYYDTDMTGPTAIVIGTEATGLSDGWRNAADAHIRIPMLGVCDSLNASVSAAILLFEALRQRRAQGSVKRI